MSQLCVYTLLPLLSPVLDLVFQRFAVIFKKAKQTKRKSDQVMCLIPQGLLTILRIKSTGPRMTWPLRPPPTLSPTQPAACLLGAMALPAQLMHSEKGHGCSGDPAILSSDGSMIWRARAMLGLLSVLKLTAGGQQCETWNSGLRVISFIHSLIHSSVLNQPLVGAKHLEYNS